MARLPQHVTRVDTPNGVRYESRGKQLSPGGPAAELPPTAPSPVRGRKSAWPGSRRLSDRASTCVPALSSAVVPACQAAASAGLGIASAAAAAAASDGIRRGAR